GAPDTLSEYNQQSETRLRPRLRMQKASRQEGRQYSRGRMGSKKSYWLVCGTAAAVLRCAPASAEPRDIDIPSEEAARSIPEFARQENIQIIAPVSQLHGINTPAVSGRMALDEALKALLVGTGLEVASDDGST